jgi:hypothetical protein
MSFGAIVFMGVTWTLLIGLNVFCFLRVLSNRGK